jgi:hypothetical protein
MTTKMSERKAAATGKVARTKPAKEARNAQRPPAVASKKAKPEGKAGSIKKAGGLKSSTIQPGSKTAKIIELLKRPGGVTLKEIMKATGWQAHSVRGFISGTLRKKLRLRIDSFKRDDTERSYRVSAK